MKACKRPTSTPTPWPWAMNAMARKVPLDWSGRRSHAQAPWEALAGPWRPTLCPSRGSTWLRGGSRVREGETGLELRPSLTLHWAAAWPKDWYLTVPNASASTICPGPRLGERAAMHPVLISGSVPIQSGNRHSLADLKRGVLSWQPPTRILQGSGRLPEPPPTTAFQQGWRMQGPDNWFIKDSSRVFEEMKFAANCRPLTDLHILFFLLEILLNFTAQG